MIINLEQVKPHLQLTHDLDDTRIQDLIDSAERECLNYLHRDTLPQVGETSSESSSYSGEAIEPDVVNGIIVMVKADYDGDPAQREDYRRAARSLWDPYRTGLGV